jgi:hypothetical protein
MSAQETHDQIYQRLEREVLDDYIKAIPLLTINGNSSILQKQVEELAEKTNSNDYLLKANTGEPDWDTPEMVRIKSKKSKRLGQYSESDIVMLKNSLGILFK